MKRSFLKTLALLLALPVAASAIVFTSDTTITPESTTYEGVDIIISNATLTVDGPHTFANLLVGPGGTITHSFSANGTITTNILILDEPQILDGTNEFTFANQNVIPATVLVKDLSGTITYQVNTDYLVRLSGTSAYLSRSVPSTIPDGVIVLVSYAIPGGTIPAGLNLTVTGNVEVATGGFITANGRGFGGNTGTGNGGETGTTLTGAGASHGGYGGLSSSNAPGGIAYGVFNQPSALGSGGGQGVGGVGGAGGGAIKLTVLGTALINGVISVNALNATNSRSGGGSGGSIWLTTQTLAGTGTITAHGGNGEPIHGGGGGGGRIAIYSDTNDFTGVVAAYGGTGWRTGGAGTVFTLRTTDTGLVLLDNGGRLGTNSLTDFNNTPDLIVRNGANLISPGNLTVRDVTIGSNSVLFVSPTSPTLTLNARNFTVELGGAILGDNIGNNSAGRGNSGGGGGGHGGYGGSGSYSNSNGAAVGGVAYGTQNAPTGIGSSGGGAVTTGYSPGGLGGGAIRLNISSTLLVNGKVSANGSNAIFSTGSSLGGGGGSGGSLYLNAQTLSGTGSLTAHGGDGLNATGGGGGGGGRIALTFFNYTFTGTVAAIGGTGANSGGAGTIYFRTNSNSSERVLLNNGGRSGANTPVSSVSSLTDLIISDGAAGELFATSTANLRQLWIKTNSALTISNVSASQLTIQFSGNATIDAGGIFSMSGRGYTGGSGPGAGSTSSAGPRGGGSHGGFGGFGGNGANGSVLSPSTPGSGGGNGSGTFGSPYGGTGGGSLRITFANPQHVLTINGTLSADGLIGQSSSGGGAGGSLWLSPYILTGNGKITANGGAGNGSAGGGGGGRISINYNSNSFTGQITAYGGPGAIPGGAGTVYLRPNPATVGSVILDNGGLIGTNTPISSAYSFPTPRYDLTLTGAASALVLTSQQLSNLTLNANSVITMRTNETNIFLDVLRNATIASGAAINVNGRGFGSGAGPGLGASLASKGAGGGHGGLGGNSQSGATGGTNYDSTSQPVLRGSGGGAGANSYVGGCEGGGAVRFTVGGTLHLAGIISADGNPGLQDDSGGGAGGSVWIAAGQLIGAGMISATGGDGDLFGGGGGGGGRIAIYCPTNQFAGSFNVLGGSGANNGFTGTVFISTNLGPVLTISGTITTTNALPVAGATVQALGVSGTITTTTDSAGNYALEVPSGWPGGAVTPSSGTNVFLPSYRSYNTTVKSVSNQNFTMFPSITPITSVLNDNTNLYVSWNGFAGVTYWPQWSTNLVDWSFLDIPIPGSNGVMQIPAVPFDAPAKYFRIQASY